jgi:hypothetical protein
MEIVVGEEEGLYNDAVTFGKVVKGSRCCLFYLLTCLMFGGTGKNHKNLSHDNCFLGLDLHPGPPEYEAGVQPFICDF